MNPIHATLAASIFCAPAIAVADDSTIDPDQFSGMKQLTDAPTYFRETTLSAENVKVNWPFTTRKGTIGCLRVDGVDFAFFDREDSDGPFLLHDNPFMIFIGSRMAGSGYLREGLNPKTISAEIGAIYHAALARCGPPYSQ